MKTFYTFLLVVFVAFTASAQTVWTLPVIEKFDNTAVAYKVTTKNKALEWKDSSEPKSTPADVNHVISNGNSTNTMNLAITTVGINNNIIISWMQHREEEIAVLSSFTASINGGTPENFTNAVITPAGHVVGQWYRVTLYLPVRFNGKNNVAFEWVVTKRSGNAVGSNFRFDEIILEESPVPLNTFPVELASFQGQTVNKAAKLAWVTATEKNNDKFVVERSQDGKSFSQVGEVKGSGNSATKRNYNYTDNAPAAGVNYYRLSQVDFDGTVTFSNVVALEVAGGSIGATVYPTVASTKAVTISLQNVKGAASISVVDATGRPVATFTNTTAREIELPVHNLRSGMYFVRVTDGQSQQVQRFIKK